jgi:undecaprenyl-phosphate 4-deoxy-4-formamido-L-arabinose transferase
LIKNEIAQALPLMQNSYTFMDGYISWITAHCGSCVVSHNERIGGHSSYDTRKLIQHTINIFVTFSNFPLKLLTKTSIFIFFINLAYTIYILYRKLTLDDFATGYPSLIIAIGFGVSLIMLSLGIIGEYLYRINLKTTKKPNYFFFD